MDGLNPYVAPGAAVVAAPTDRVEGRLAGRGERLAAALLDTLIALAIMGPLMLAGGFWADAMAAAEAGTRIGWATGAAWGLIGFIVLVLVQGWPLAKSAQTWGKRAVGIRIMKLDGTRPGLAHLLLRRYLPAQLLAMVPFAGNLLSAANVLLIFRPDRRCGHDLVAGTRVVRVR